MSRVREMVTWQPVLTDHQAFTYEALGKRLGVPVLAYVAVLEDEARRAQGWHETRVHSVERRVVPRTGQLAFYRRELAAHRDALHFFGSPFECVGQMLCMLLALSAGVEFYLVSEPYSPTGHGYLSDRARFGAALKARLRPWIYGVYGRVLRAGAAGVFAISELAVQQYRAAGFPSSKLFPFGYFVPSAAEVAGPRPTPESAALRLVFVGSLITRKGIDVLVEAVRRAHRAGIAVTLDVFGAGDPGTFDIDGSVVVYRGRSPFGETQRLVASYDALVLPSRFDGWGVVVNEALSAGVPVVCSDTVGAGVLLDTYAAGARFPSGDAVALASLLASLARDPELLARMRAGARVAAEKIQPEVAAEYMHAVLTAAPAARSAVPSPWYRQEGRP